MQMTCLETCVEQVHQHTNIPKENPGVTLPNRYELRGQMPADVRVVHIRIEEVSSSNRTERGTLSGLGREEL